MEHYMFIVYTHYKLIIYTLQVKLVLMRKTTLQYISNKSVVQLVQTMCVIKVNISISVWNILVINYEHCRWTLRRLRLTSRNVNTSFFLFKTWKICVFGNVQIWFEFRLGSNRIVDVDN